jgi:hypothetical protein
MLGRIEQHATTDEALLGHVLHAQVAHANDHVARPALVRLLAIAAVVEEIALRGADANVAWPVELRADLADLGGHQFVVEHEPVAAERSSSGCARDVEAETAGAEERDVGGVKFTQRRGLALLHQLDCFEHDLGRGAVDRPRLVVGAPLARPPVLLERLVVELLPGGAERQTDPQPAYCPG